MSIRDDYPAMTTLADACAERVDEACPEAVRAWRELDRLRQWRDDALNELSEWDTVHAEVAGASAHLGRTKAENVRREMHRLRGQCEVWKNGVADVVEPWGYDREAACGPADLLPGLTELARRLRECVEARRHLYARSETGTLDEGGGLMSEETRSPAVSPNEAAAILGVSRQTVHALINRGELRRFKVGRLTRIPRGDVLALVGGAL